MKRKIFLYSTSFIIFAMYWAMFTALSNWWIGLLTAGSLTVLQWFVHRALNKIKLVK